MGASVQDVVGVQMLEHEHDAGCVELGGVVGEEGDLGVRHCYKNAMKEGGRWSVQIVTKRQ